MCINTAAYTYTHTYIYIYIYMYKNTTLYIYIYIYIYIYKVCVLSCEEVSVKFFLCQELMATSLDTYS